MVSSNIDVILSELGWQDGFRIPVANEENKKLEEEIEKKTKYRNSLSEKLESADKRLKEIKEHAVHLAVQHVTNQKLMTAHSGQLEAEENWYQLSNNTESRLRQEARDYEKERNDLEQRVINIEKEVVGATKKIEAQKRAVKFDKDILLKFEEQLSRKEEDNQIIEKYMKEDSKEFQKLELQRQKLSLEVEVYRETIVRVVDEVREMEIMLDRTAKMYEEAIKERRQMIHQWTQSVTALKQRDDSIQKALREIEILREIAKDKLNVLEEKEKFLSDQIADNKELEDSIKQSEKKLAATKQEYRNVFDAVGKYAMEVQTQRKSLEELTRRTQQMRSNAKQKKMDTENKYTKIEDWKKRIDELISTLEEIGNQDLSATDQMKQLEQMMEQEEKRDSAMAKEMKRLQALILRTSNRIKEMESERKLLELQIQNERKKFEMLTAAQAKEEKVLCQVEESLYHVEYTVQKCEIKLERLKGREHDKNEADRRQKLIDELQAIYSEKMEVSKLLQNQLASLEHEMKKISSSLANDSRELERLKNKTQDLVLSMEGGEKRLKTAKSRSEEKQVEENLLRLKVFQLRKMMLNVGKKVYNLEKYRLELDAALRERNAEIAVQQEALIVEKRIIGSECSELRSSIAERKNRIRQLQARYDGSIAAMCSNPDGTPIDTTYLKIQSAQERYLLHEQGDKLDETIRKTEQEIRSMENTLRVVNACNDKYKASVSFINEEGPEEMERLKLDKEMQEVRLKLRQRRTDLQRITDDIQRLDEKYASLLDQTERTKETKEDKQRALFNLEKQIYDQKEKLSRAEKSLRKAYKDIQTMRPRTPDNIVPLQERDVTLREVQEQNTLALQDIVEFAIRHVEVEAYIKKLLSAKNIDLPTIPPGQSPAGSRCGSIADSSECPSRRSISRTGTLPSSRESASSIVNIQPQFEAPPQVCSYRRNGKSNISSTRSASSTQCITLQRSKYSAIRKS